MNRDIFRFAGIRKKIIVYYLIMTFILGATSLFSYYNARVILSKMNTIIVDYVYLNDMNNNVNLLMTELEKYLTTKSSEDLLSYYTIYNSLQEKSMNIPRNAAYDNDYLMLKDIGYMIDSLLAESDNAVKAKRGRISSEYIAHFTRSNQISEYIKLYINNLLESKLQKGSDKYNAITKNMNYISYLNLFIIAAAVLVNIFLAILFTYRLTKPIIELSHSAERVSEGDFDVDLANIKAEDEVNVLANAFSKMVVSIKSYIDEIKRQAEVDKLLKEQEMQNLRMKSLLKDAELKSLQSQINPHFLFNTLNAASQLSMMEGADKASEFIESIAELFRYNLRKIDEPATLMDEIRYARNYMFILKTRFGSKIEYYTDIDESLLDVKIPCTVIQPIIENAFIHGLQNLERDGEIHLDVKQCDNRILIEVADNGKGMEQEQIEAVLSLKSMDSLQKKHVSGIGICNVIERLQLFYNTSEVEDVIEIKSKPGYGTKVTLKIPYEEDVVQDDEASNS
ncbi:MAG: sensor histidine kinase [Caulobacteraceae bacterium]